MINLYAPINPTGYGVHSTNLVGHLSRLTNFSLFPIGQVQYEGKHSQAIKNAVQHGRTDYDPTAPGVCLWHANDMARFHGKPRIAYSVFELDRLTPEEVRHLSSVDDVLVPSTWARNVVLNCVDRTIDGLKSNPDEIEVHVVPEGVDTEIYTYDKDRELDLKSGITMLNIGKFEQRKGHIHILDMMSQGKFECDLIALWHNFFIPVERIAQTIIDWGFGRQPRVGFIDEDQLNPSIKCHIFTHPNGAKIYLVHPNHNDPYFVRKLIDYADIGVFPYAAEGWNLPLIECMAAGLPCVATDYSGPTEFLSPTNHIPLKNQGLIPASDGVFFNGYGQWASVSVDELIDKIGNVHESTLTDINLSLEGFGEQWSWERSAQKFFRTVAGIAMRCQS